MPDGANLDVARAKADQLLSQLRRGAGSEEVSLLERGGGDKSVGVAKCSAQANGRRASEPAASRANRCGLREPMEGWGGA